MGNDDEIRTIKAVAHRLALGQSEDEVVKDFDHLGAENLWLILVAAKLYLKWQETG